MYASVLIYGVSHGKYEEGNNGILSNLEIQIGTILTELCPLLPSNSYVEIHASSTLESDCIKRLDF